MFRPVLSLTLLALLCSPMLAQHPEDAATRATLDSELGRIHLYAPGESWHITLHAQIVDQGTAGAAGTVDLYRNATGELRTVFAFPGFHQERFTGKTTLVVGNAGDPPAGLENFIRFFDTSTTAAEIHDAVLKSFDIKRSTVTFHCIRASNPTTGIGPTFCNIPGSPTLRYNTIGGSYVTLFVKMDTFAGGDAPTKATVFFQYQPIIRLAIDYAPLSPSDAAHMRPPSSAVLLTDESKKLDDLLDQKLVEPFVHPSPTMIVPPENGAALFRVALVGNHVENIEVLAASDHSLVRDISSNIRKTLASASLPPGHHFLNYSYVLYLLRPNADANESMPDVVPADQ